MAVLLAGAFLVVALFLPPFAFLASVFNRLVKRDARFLLIIFFLTAMSMAL